MPRKTTAVVDGKTVCAACIVIASGTKAHNYKGGHADFCSKNQKSQVPKKKEGLKTATKKTSVGDASSSQSVRFARPELSCPLRLAHFLILLRMF